MLSYRPVRAIAVLCIIAGFMMAAAPSASAQPEHRLQVSASYTNLFQEPDLFSWPLQSGKPSSFIEPGGFAVGLSWQGTLDRPWMAFASSVRYGRFTVQTESIVDALVTCSSDCIQTNTLSFSDLTTIDFTFGIGMTPYPTSRVSPYADILAGLGLTQLNRSGEIRYENDQGLPRDYAAQEILPVQDSGTLLGGTTDAEVGVQARLIDRVAVRLGVAHRYVWIRGNSAQVVSTRLSIVREFN
ncbi:MAG: hypothetical protein GVY25_12770 [Bacteroidetes bacterium]|jgi:hypothetical protein|nr:hypothetical protein [Bacteroidota bacterium]